jgi:gamma-glutamylcyclotransferase (GGCT)/AIG2-like uncharacterized protein YtfP
LFVYGTLKRGHGPIAGILWSQAEYVGDGVVSGALYDLGAYPALVDAPGLVHGELARLLAPETTLPQLDGYEGPEYQRVPRTVFLPNGSSLQAMVYLYRGSLDNASIIPSGRWMPACWGK